MCEQKQPGRGFQTTQWSLIDRVRNEDSEGTRPALDELLRRYLPALRVHLRIRGAGGEHAVEDLLQGFVKSRILEANLVATASASRGKFRTLLLTSLDRYVVDQRPEVVPALLSAIAGQQVLPLRVKFFSKSFAQ